MGKARKRSVLLSIKPATTALAAPHSPSCRAMDWSSYGGLWNPCAGSVTPWQTHFGSEEYEPDARAWCAPRPPHLRKLPSPPRANVFLDPRMFFAALCLYFSPLHLRIAAWPRARSSADQCAASAGLTAGRRTKLAWSGRTWWASTGRSTLAWTPRLPPTMTCTKSCSPTTTATPGAPPPTALDRFAVDHADRASRLLLPLRGHDDDNRPGLRHCKSICMEGTRVNV